jgi:hypothetical protein
MDAEIWIAAVAHHLQRRWRTVDPGQLEDAAGELWADATLRAMSPAEAVNAWLKPIASERADLRHQAARIALPVCIGKEQLLAADLVGRDR